jgi:CheY-like chemotaxis protein
MSVHKRYDLSQRQPDSTAVKRDCSQKKSILLVDDEVDITTVFKLSLEEEDLYVHAYNDPLLALSDYRPGTFDLLLLDVRMPKMNGFELYKRIIDIERGYDDTTNDKPQVCFITAYEEYYTQFETSFPTLEAGSFLRKPISVPDLVKAIKSQLGLL